MNDNIFEPHFSLTARIQSGLEDIDRQRWLIENVLIMPRHEAWIRRDVRLRRTAATTAIEGATLDHTEVGKLLTRPIASTLTEDERANTNAIQAYEFVDFLSDQHDIPIDELVIRQMNRYFMMGAADTLTPGVYRKGENKVGEYIPPNQGDAPSLMRAFALWLRDDTETHPVLKAGIVHIHLVGIHPFWDGNGRTARALSTLILQRSDSDFRKLLSLESHWSGIRDQYFTAIEQTLGAQFSPHYDATAWLEFFVLGVSLSAEFIANSLTDWHRWMRDGQRLMEEAGMPSRLAEGVAFANQRGSMTRNDYIEITRVSPGTASRDLARLVKHRLLVAEGNTRARVYYPPPLPAQIEPIVPSEQLSLLDNDPL